MDSPRYTLLALLLLVAATGTLAVDTWFGTLSPPLVVPSGVATDRFKFASPSNFYGLSFFGGSKGYGANMFYSIRADSSGVSEFDTIDPVIGVTADQFDASSVTATINMFTLAFAAPDLGYGSTIFYYLRTDYTHDAKCVFGYITPGGAVGATVDLVVYNMTTNFDALTFAAADVGAGANLLYFLRHDNGTCMSHFGVIDPGTLKWYDLFSLAPLFDTIYFTEADVGYGPNLFYYLRHDSQGISTFGVIDPVAKNFTDKYVLPGENYNELAFTTTATNWDPNLFYYMRGAPFECVPDAISTTAATTAVPAATTSGTTATGKTTTTAATTGTTAAATTGTTAAAAAATTGTTAAAAAATTGTTAAAAAATTTTAAVAATTTTAAAAATTSGTTAAAATTTTAAAAATTTAAAAATTTIAAAAATTSTGTTAAAATTTAGTTAAAAATTTVAAAAAATTTTAAAATTGSTSPAITASSSSTTASTSRTTTAATGATGGELGAGHSLVAGLLFLFAAIALLL